MNSSGIDFPLAEDLSVITNDSIHLTRFCVLIYSQLVATISVIMTPNTLGYLGLSSGDFHKAENRVLHRAAGRQIRVFSIYE